MLEHHILHERVSFLWLVGPNGLLRQRSSAAPRPRQYLEGIKTRLIRNGPDALTPREIKSLMYNPDAMLQLHYDLWSASATDLAPWWVQAMRHYNLSKG